MSLQRICIIFFSINILHFDCYCAKGLWCCFPLPLLILIYSMIGLLICKYAEGSSELFWSTFVRCPSSLLSSSSSQAVHIFILFFRITGPISTKLGTKHPLVMGIQTCSNEEPHLFPRGDIYGQAKINWRNLKIFSRTTGPIPTKLGQCIIGWREIKFVQMKCHAKGW